MEPNSVEKMADALKEIGRIDRRECRKRIEVNFTTELMVDHCGEEFLKLFSHLQNKEKTKSN